MISMATIYAESIALQAHLDLMPQDSEERDTTLSVGLRLINSRWDPSLPRAARASSAYFIDDGLTMDSLLTPSQEFGEVLLKGRVPRIGCIDLIGRLTIAIPFYDAVVIGPSQEIEPELIDYELDDCDSFLPIGVTIRRPIYTPIESLSFIALTA